MKTKDLKPGMLVFHREWDRRTSNPMKVISQNGKIMLLPIPNPENLPPTEPLAGGESDDGWEELKRMETIKTLSFRMKKLSDKEVEELYKVWPALETPYAVAEFGSWGLITIPMVPNGAQMYYVEIDIEGGGRDVWYEIIDSVI